MVLVIRGAVFDGKETLERGAVVVDQERGAILDVGREGGVDLPSGAKAIGGQGFTVFPGLVDAHLHFFGSPAYALLAWVTVPESLVVLRSVAHLRALMKAGFTAVRDMVSKGGAHLARALREGVIDGPTVLSCA